MAECWMCTRELTICAACAAEIRGCDYCASAAEEEDAWADEEPSAEFLEALRVIEEHLAEVRRK